MPINRPFPRFLALSLICSFILPDPAYALRKQQAVDSSPAEALLAAGMEENAWNPKDSAKWKVYGGETAALLADRIGWRKGLEIADLDSPVNRGVEQVGKLLSEKSGEFLLVENAKGDFALAGEAGPRFGRLRERALDGILLEPLTAGLVDRETPRIVELLKQMGLPGDLKAAPRLKAQYPEGEFGIAARDRDTGELVGFISAARGDDMVERPGWGTVYIPYNVVDGQWRSKGIGRLLFESVLSAAAAAREPSVRQVIWESFNNPQAQQFYDRMGGKRVATTYQFAVNSLIANRTAYQIELPLPATPSAGVEQKESLEKYLKQFPVGREMEARHPRVYPGGAPLVVLHVQADDGRFLEGIIEKRDLGFSRKESELLGRIRRIPVRVAASSFDPGKNRLNLRFDVVNKEDFRKQMEEARRLDETLAATDSLSFLYLQSYQQRDFKPGLIYKVRVLSLHPKGRGAVVLTVAPDGRPFKGFIPNVLASSYEDQLWGLWGLGEFEARLIHSEIEKKGNQRSLRLMFGVWDADMQERLQVLSQTDGEVEAEISRADGYGLRGHFGKVPVFVPMSTVTAVVGKHSHASLEEWKGVRIRGEITDKDTNGGRLQLKFLGIVPEPGNAGPAAGMEQAAEFESLELFMNRYAEVLAKQNRLGWINTLKERNLAPRVWVVPAPAAADQRQVTAYVTSEAPEEQAVWELKVAERLNREKDRLKGTFFDVKPLARDSEFEKISVIIRQTRGVKPKLQGDHPAVIELGVLEEVEELRPSWVYAVAVNEKLWGREIGPVVGVLTFQDETGRWVHAIFA